MAAHMEQQNRSYDGLSREQLIRLLEKRDRERKLGLVWERDEIESDRSLEGEFVAATPVPELHELAAPWRNFVIEGDNYDALRWLRMTWAGRIKCVYVDPPYNTGNRDWVYNDRYFSVDDRWRHSTWLEFLYRRFALARDLLTDDGVILVSINDENRAKLELLLEEVLPGMRIGSFVWRTKDTSNDAGRNFSAVHEHILIYGNKSFSFFGHKLKRDKYKNLDGDIRGDYSPDPITKAHSYTERPNTFYPIQDPKTGWWYPCSPDRVWSLASRSKLKVGQRLRTQTIEDLIDDGRIYFSAKEAVVYGSREQLLDALRKGTDPRDGKGRVLLRLDLYEDDFWVGKPIGLGRPYVKSFWNEKTHTTKPVSSYILGVTEKGSDELAFLVSEKQGQATGEIEAIFGKKAFQFPKPSSLIKALVSVCASNSDVVLDFFAGSGTTAQAVMALNAEDDNDRRFIMVSSTEATAEEPDKNLCRSVTAERIRRLNASNSPTYSRLSAEFAYLRCRKLAFEDFDYDLRPEEVWAALEALHQLPLTIYDGAPWTPHETEDLALVYVDRFTEDFLAWLEARVAMRKPTFVYAWAPGQVRERLARAEIEVRGVRETLVHRFRQ